MQNHKTFNTLLYSHVSMTKASPFKYFIIVMIIHYYITTLLPSIRVDCSALTKQYVSYLFEFCWFANHFRLSFQISIPLISTSIDPLLFARYSNWKLNISLQSPKIQKHEQQFIFPFDQLESIQLFLDRFRPSGFYSIFKYYSNSIII